MKIRLKKSCVNCRHGSRGFICKLENDIHNHCLEIGDNGRPLYRYFVLKFRTEFIKVEEMQV